MRVEMITFYAITLLFRLLLAYIAREKNLIAYINYLLEDLILLQRQRFSLAIKKPKGLRKKAEKTRVNRRYYGSWK
jgi:hypothetical protein